MRPRGDCRVATKAALGAGRGTTVDLAVRTGWAVPHTRRALDAMCRSGEAVVAGHVRRDGVRRPVPVYESAADGVYAVGDQTAEVGVMWVFDLPRFVSKDFAGGGM